MLSVKSIKVKNVYREQFWALPERTQVVLAAAAGTVPRADHRVWPFVRDVVAEVASRSEGIEVERREVLEEISQVAERKVWLVGSAASDSFREALQVEIAHEHLGELLVTSTTEALRETAARVFAERLDEVRRSGYLLDDSPESGVLSRWLLEVSASDQRSAALLAAAFRGAADLASTYKYAEAARLVESRIDPDLPPHQELAWIRHEYALWLARAGEMKRAISEIRAVHSAQRELLGPCHPDVLRTRGSLAFLIGRAGEVAEALTLLRELLLDQINVLGPDHPETFVSRRNLAGFTGQTGRVKEAVAAFRDLVAEEGRIRGYDHPATMVTRRTHAWFVGESGAHAEAVRLLEALLQDQARVLGAGDPDCLQTRASIAWFLGEMGRCGEAVQVYRRLVDEQTLILGPDSPEILSTRSNLGWMIASSGFPGEAITELRAFLEDKDRVLGVDDPRSQNRRRNLDWFRAQHQPSDDDLKRADTPKQEGSPEDYLRAARVLDEF